MKKAPPTNPVTIPMGISSEGCSCKTTATFRATSLFETDQMFVSSILINPEVGL